MIRTLSQNKILHSLIGKLNIPADVKEDLVHQYTNGRETKSSAMTPEECQALINHLNFIKRQRVEVVPNAKPVLDNNNPENKMRRKILSLCHEMQLKLANGKIDMTRVNKLCVERGYKHKELNQYTRTELPLLVTQFERMTRDYLKGKQHA